MTFTGQVVDGQVILSDPLPLPNGTTVKVEAIVAEPQTRPVADRSGAMLDRYRSVVGKIDLPVDAAEQHDHYLYGTPKR
jgi:hypothetical protein